MQALTPHPSPSVAVTEAGRCHRPRPAQRPAQAGRCRKRDDAPGSRWHSYAANPAEAQYPCTRTLAFLCGLELVAKAATGAAPHPIAELDGANALPAAKMAERITENDIFGRGRRKDP